MVDAARAALESAASSEASSARSCSRAIRPAGSSLARLIRASVDSRVLDSVSASMARFKEF
jgi:hypothetical protein